MDKIIKQGTRVYLRTPKREEIHFLKSLWTAEQNTKGIGATGDATEEEYQSWYADKVDPGNPAERYLIIFENENDIPVGEINIQEIDTDTGTAAMDVTVKGKYRRRGFGRESLMLLCDFFFIDFGGDLITCSVETENNPGRNMLVNFGFSQQEENEQKISYSLKKSDYLPE